jgi:pimeloyl-ACP methyl ester carboxylesterase
MLLDALQIHRCSVIGNSMGGIAAQALAAARIDAIENSSWSGLERALSA